MRGAGIKRSIVLNGVTPCFQVRNIHNCIKVAEDFVSPENLEWCFYQVRSWRNSVFFVVGDAVDK
jgi:hypothetical protein